MSIRHLHLRLASVALGLCLLMLADALPVVSQPVAMGATGDDAATQSGSGPSDALACATGFEDTASRADMSLHGVALTGAGAMAVGFSPRRPNDFGRRRPVAMRNDDGQWVRTFTASPGQEDGLVAVAAGRGATAWAVGFTTINGQAMPLAMRWNGRSWSVVRPPRRGSAAAMFTDVAVVGKGDEPLAVGYRMSSSGRRRPIVARRSGRVWRFIDPRTGPRESVSLTGVAPDGEGSIWAVGHGGPSAQIGPVIYRRSDGRWQRQKTPRVKGEGVLSDVVARSSRDVWAVGYQRHNRKSVPLVLHFDGSRWHRVEAPAFDSPDVMLTAVSAAPAGGIWVVGAAWNEELRDHEAVAAWWDGLAWNEVAGTEGGNELHDVAGSLDGDGWAVGRAGTAASTTRVCTPPQAGTFGGSEPAGADSLALTDGLALPPAVDPGFEDAAAVVPEVIEAEAVAPRRFVRPRRRRRRPSIQALPTPTTQPNIVARNVAREAGIAEVMNTFGAEVADFDADGTDDLYIGRHGGRGRLVLNRDGHFVDNAAMRFPAVDRHGCAAADVDGSGLPDLYCTIGSKRGSSLKTNELWIDPGGPAPYDAATELGLSDPTGRGRDAEFLEARKTDKASLVVTNSPTRVDGLPSPGRLFRTDGHGTFSTRSRTGFAPRLGSLATEDVDFDGDGREDLLLVTGGQQAPEQEGTWLYRNTKRGLVDVTAQMGISRFGEVDAALVDINGDSKMDLVQLSKTRLRVSVLRNGRYVRVYERALTHGRAIAGGDVNGDKRDDLYIVRADGDRNPADVMLINRRGGRVFSSMVIPQVYSGDGDDVVAIDHDGNGRDDFLVLNGRTRRGPIELIAFYPR